MNRLIIPAVIVATAMAGAAWSAPAAQTQNNRYFMMPLEKDPTREVGLQSVTMPPGAGNEFHRHPGEQWTAIQEGEITFTIKGKPPQVLKAGEYNHVPRGTVHRQQNLEQPASALYRDADLRQRRARVRAGELGGSSPLVVAFDERRCRLHRNGGS